MLYAIAMGQITSAPCDLTCGSSRECVHLVTRGHFRSRNKDGGHSMRFAVAENPMLHAKLTALSYTEPELWAIFTLRE